MLFGISTAPGIWQREIDRILAGVAGTVCYIDDILAVGENESQHDERLMAVLQKLDKAGLKLKREKCEFSKSQVEYLGHVISSRGIQLSESKVAAIRDAPPPTSVTELKAFLGLLSYYRKFLPNLSSVLEPLYELLQKQRQWSWGTGQMKAFLEAKQKLLQSDFLVHYDLKKPVILCCDASPAGVGACLSHVIADGTERPIAFASRTLSQAEGKYVQLEKEAPALIFGVRQFHKYLVGRQFTLVTDRRPLLRILGPHVGVPTLAAARLQRWALILSAYDYEIQYKPGVETKEADLLSRLPIPVEVIDPNEQTFNVDYCEALPVTAAEIAKETQRDRILRRVYQDTNVVGDQMANQS